MTKLDDLFWTCWTTSRILICPEQSAWTCHFRTFCGCLPVPSQDTSVWHIISRPRVIVQSPAQWRSLLSDTIIGLVTYLTAEHFAAYKTLRITFTSLAISLTHSSPTIQFPSVSKYRHLQLNICFFSKLSKSDCNYLADDIVDAPPSSEVLNLKKKLSFIFYFTLTSLLCHFLYCSVHSVCLVLCVRFYNK